MTIEFPERERVFYKKTPLVEVLFQIRMPRILEIEHQLPVEFQKVVKNDFPILETRTEQALVFDAQNPEASGPQPHSTLYDFVSRDRNWKLTLGSQFFALSTTKYTSWEEFRGYSENAIGWVLKQYEPPLFTRIGLRYQDVINRNALELNDVLWKDLLSPAISGVLSNVMTVDGEVRDFSTYQTVAQFRIEGGNATLKHGLAKNKESQEVGYLIDGDYYTLDEIEPNLKKTLAILDDFHTYSGRVFRWAITERLHDAMGPEPI